VRVVVPALLAASLAVTVITLLPTFSGTEADHDVVPDARPLPPVAAFDQVTLVTPTLSEAVPPTTIGEDDVLVSNAVTGLVMETVGGVLSFSVVAFATLV